MLNHQFVGVITCLFAEIGVDGDVATYELLERGAYIADDTTGAYDDAAHNTKVPGDTVAIQLKRGCDESVNVGGLTLTHG